MPTGGSVKLTVDSDKTGYVILPNGVLLTTVAGVINATYSGLEGNILYLVPNNADVISIANSGIEGGVIYDGSRILDCDGNIALVSIIADNTKVVYSTGSSLTAKAIGDILQNLYTLDVDGCEIAFDGGANALQGAVDTYLQATYSGLTYANVYALLVTANGGLISIDTV
jgi:hypothetical protein